MRMMQECVKVGHVCSDMGGGRSHTWLVVQLEKRETSNILPLGVAGLARHPRLSSFVF